MWKHERDDNLDIDHTQLPSQQGMSTAISFLWLSYSSRLSFFLGELEKCLEDPEKLGSLFVKHVSVILLLMCRSDTVLFSDWFVRLKASSQFTHMFV